MEIANLDDLKRVESLAQAARDAKAKVASDVSARAASEEDAVVAALDSLESRFAQFAQALRGRVGIYVKRIPKGRYTQLDISVSSAPTWLRLPHRRILVSAWPRYSEEAGAIEVGFNCMSAPAVHQDLPSSAPIGSDLPRASVVSTLELMTADFLSSREQFQFVAPNWYTMAGNFLAWPLSIGVWLLTMAGAGGWGIVFGWIPALMLFYFARNFWLPALLAGVWWLSR